MTNLIFNERTPDSPTEVNRFLIRGAPEPLAQDATATPGSGVKFLDCSTCMFNVRAKLTQPLTNAGIAQSLRIVVKDREGNDTAAGKGADEWDYNLDLHQFNTSTMTTFSIPLSSFTRNMTSTTLGPPVGFDNFGDGTLSNFGLYEFGGLILAGGGLLKLEMEYMEIRLAAAGLAGDFNNDGKVDSGDYATWRKNSANASLPNDNGLTTQAARFGLWQTLAVCQAAAADSAILPCPNRPQGCYCRLPRRSLVLSSAGQAEMFLRFSLDRFDDASQIKGPCHASPEKR